MPVGHMVDTTFYLMAEWASQSEQQMTRVQNLFRYFHDRETEYETGEIILPGWASIGNVAQHYELDDADPFATLPEQSPDTPLDLTDQRIGGTDDD